MAINFPNSPTNNQIFVDPTSGNRYIYDATKGFWKSSSNVVVSIASAAYEIANSGFDKANSANVLAYNTGIGANNYAGAMANSANAYAASLTPDLSPAFDKANAANVLAYNTGIGANNYAGALANVKLANVVVGGPLTVTFNTSVGNTTATLNISSSAAAGSYSSGISVITVDTYGRVTSVTGSAGYITAASPTFTGTVNMNANNASQTLTDAATIAWDVSLGQIATVTLTAAGRTMGAPTNLKVGTYILHVVQDGSGSRTITTWNSVFKWPGGVAPVLTTTASARDLFSFVCDGTNLYGSFLPDVK